MLELGYLSLTGLMMVIIFIIGFMAIDKTFSDKAKATKKKWKLVLWMLLWQVYTYRLAATGFLMDYSFPPRFVILLILPAFIFTGIFIYKNRNNQWLAHVSPSTLVYYQTFRILIETLFIFSVAQGVLHRNVTIEGYNYDMVFAATAPIVAYLVFNKKMMSEKFALAWNYFGLVVIAFIIFIFITTIFFPSFYGSDTSLMPLEFATYPYVVVPAFLMPSAVFMHVLSIVQLSRKAK